MQFARQPACRFISLFNYIPLAERGQIHASKSHCIPSRASPLANQKTAKGAPRLSNQPSIFRVGLAFSGNIHAAPIHRNQFRNSAKSRPVRNYSAPFPCRSNPRSCSSRQFRHRHPVFSSAFNAGIGMGGNPAHQQPPSGLQLMAASQRAHRVSIAPFSLVRSALSTPAAIKSFQLISSPS
jgi:hypothetical protein